MADPSLLAQRLIGALGGAFSRELGIRLDRGEAGEIFRWFLAAKLMGARIATASALRTFRELDRRGVSTPGRIRRTGWDGLVAILDAGGYARYDFSTASRLLDIADRLLARYGGDLNSLHEEAEDPEDLEKRLKALGKGIGDVTVNIFLRELRGIWPKSAPSLSPLVVAAARHLGLLAVRGEPMAALRGIWAAAGTPGRDFRDFEAALLRLGKDFCRKGRCAPCPMGDLCPGRRTPGERRRPG